jgi:hypothetical protein
MAVAYSVRVGLRYRLSHPTRFRGAKGDQALSFAERKGTLGGRFP